MRRLSLSQFVGGQHQQPAMSELGNWQLLEIAFRQTEQDFSTDGLFLDHLDQLLGCEEDFREPLAYL